MGTPTLFLLFVASSAFAVCPNGTVFESQFNKCYQYVSQTTSFPLAEKNCEHMGGTLLSILNSFENSYVSLIASQYASSNQTFWIGINSIYYTNWTWINKDPSTYRNWAADQPNNSVQCGSMQLGNNQWSTTICNYAMPYMCQIRANITGSCPAGHCSDPGYVLNPDSCKCYKYIGWTFYNESEALCAGEDATLPIILNANDNEFLEHLVRAYNHPWVWLGLQCPSTLTTSCTWQDGTPLQGFTNFTSGYPHANEYAYMQTTDGSWNTNSGRDNGINCVCQKMEYPKRLLSWLLLKKKQIELDTSIFLCFGWNSTASFFLNTLIINILYI